MDATLKAIMPVNYIRNLGAFKIVVPTYPYHHMGAIITDAILQAGLDWQNVVKPRIGRVRSYQEATQTSGFLKLLEEQGPCNLLEWFDEEKPNRVLGVARFLNSETVQTEDDLKSWFSTDANATRLMGQRGIGNKTLDYIKMLAGLSTVAIDRHMNRLLEEVNVPSNGYLEARSIIGRAAELMSIKKHVLDHSIWTYMSGKARPSPSTQLRNGSK